QHQRAAGLVGRVGPVAAQREVGVVDGARALGAPAVDEAGEGGHQGGAADHGAPGRRRAWK
ncbi:MAG: hypothetical protein ACK56I_05100, partial [bacterium]